MRATRLSGEMERLAPAETDRVGELYLRHAPGAVRLAYLLTGDHTLAELESTADSVIARLKHDGPTAEELAKTKAGLEFQFVSQLQSNIASFSRRLNARL